MLLPVTWSGNFPVAVAYFIISYLPLYGVVGLVNAYVDKDYKVNKRFLLFSIIVYSLVGISPCILMPSLFVPVLLFIGLGILYNSFPRKILFLDHIIMTFTCFWGPIFYSDMAINHSANHAIHLATFASMPFFFFLNIRHFKGWEDDKKRRYQTIATLFPLKTAKTLLILLTLIGYILFVGNYFIFGLDKIFIIFSIIYAVSWISAVNSVIQDNSKRAHAFMHMNFNLYFLILMLSKPTYLFLPALIVALIILDLAVEHVIGGKSL